MISSFFLALSLIVKHSVHTCVLSGGNNRCTSHNQIFVCMRNKIYFKLYKALNKSTYS